MSPPDAEGNKGVGPAGKPENRLFRFVTHAVTAVLGGVVAWLVSVYFEEKHIALEMEKDKVEIIRLVKDQDTPLALILIQYFDETFGAGDANYRKFLTTVSNYISTAPSKLTKEQPIATDAAGTTSDIIQNQFFSVNRRQYAEYLVDLYKKATSDQKSQIVSALLGAILPEGSDHGYRVNLYIALTFSLLPNTKMDNANLDRLKKLKDLKDYKDTTFKLNVDNALTKQAPT
jgi:hypothetical protein